MPRGSPRPQSGTTPKNSDQFLNSSFVHLILIFLCCILLPFDTNKVHTFFETYRFFLYGLTAPLGSSCQEPGDGEYDPPDDTSNGEEVEQHEKQSAAFALRAQHHCVHTCRMSRFGTGRIVPQQEANKVYERDEAVAHGVEDYGTLGVTEALDINEESEEGEERGTQTDDGAHADKALCKFNVMGFEVHVGARWSAVLGAQEG